MNDTDTALEDHNEPGLYEIRIKGHMDTAWTGWFEGMTITLENNSATLITGLVADQAALHGLLKQVRDLGLPLVSVIQIHPKQGNGPNRNADTELNRSNKETEI